ncbi:MAG: glycosyltransferase family 4 protein [Thermoplasmata archaeon]
MSREELEALSKTLAWQRCPIPPPITRVEQAPLRILMVGWEFPPAYAGGLGIHCYEICRELTRMGHKVTFLSPNPGPFTEVEGVTHRSPGGPSSTDGGEVSQPYIALDVNDPKFLDDLGLYNDFVANIPDVKKHDVIHVHDWLGTDGAARLSASSGVPLVMTMHSTEYDRSLGNPWPEILAREELGLAHAHRVIAVSRHLKDQLVERYRVPEARIRVVYNAVRPTDRLSPLESSQSIVLYLGRLVAMKGVETFLRAAAQVAPRSPGTLFVMAGEGPEYPRLLTLAAHLGIADRVLFLGRVTEDERSLLLAAASVFVLPSVTEPFGIAALEAMAAGVPTIVSKTSGVAEVTRNVFAIDFWDIDEFASRMLELLEYPALRRSMGERGRWDALKSGWPERTIETVAVYLEAIANLRSSS